MPQNQKRPTPAEVKHVLQQAVLNSYPNPDRRGCPGTDVLRTVAQLWLPPEDERWEHISQCSPCYREFLNFRHAHLKRQRWSRIRSRTLKASVIALVLAAPAVYWRMRNVGRSELRVTEADLTKTQTAPSAVSSNLPAILDFKNDSITRGIETEPPSLTTPQRVPRGRLALSIYLPIGSEPGSYEIHIVRRQVDQKPIVSLSGSAQIENGLTTLHMNIDLSGLTPGTYTLATRHEDETWRYHTFTVF